MRTQRVSKNELAVLSEIKSFVSGILPVRPAEGQALSGAVSRLLIALLGLKNKLAVSFSGRSLVKPDTLEDPTVSRWVQTLAGWLNEETEFDKKVRVV